MMKKFTYILLLFGIISCEKVIPFDGDVNTPKLVINSVFESDSTFKVHVSSSRSVIDTASFKFNKPFKVAYTRFIAFFEP